MTSHFYMSSNHLSKHIFHSDWDTSKTCWRRKSLTTHFVFLFFWYVGIKPMSMGAKSGLYGEGPINSTFWPVNKTLVWAHIVMLNNDSSSLVLFSNFSEDKQGKQIVVYRLELTVQRCSSETVATWSVLPKKQATICFEVIFPQTTFVGFGSTS